MFCSLLPLQTHWKCRNHPTTLLHFSSKALPEHLICTYWRTALGDVPEARAGGYWPFTNPQQCDITQKCPAHSKPECKSPTAPRAMPYGAFSRAIGQSLAQDEQTARSTYRCRSRGRNSPNRSPGRPQRWTSRDRNNRTVRDVRGRSCCHGQQQEGRYSWMNKHHDPSCATPKRHCMSPKSYHTY